MFLNRSETAKNTSINDDKLNNVKDSSINPRKFQFNNHEFMSSDLNSRKITNWNDKNIINKINE